jgi:hypothetical protein
MNWRGDRYGSFGIRKKHGNLSRPYYGSVHFRGQRFNTRYYARRGEAEVAIQIMDAALRLAAEMGPAVPSQDGGAP